MRTICVSMQKGGVGKTTTAAHLAAAIADLEKRVLLVDTDPQCQQAQLFGVEVNDERTVSQVMMNGVEIFDCLYSVRGFQLLPGDRTWTDADYKLFPLMDGRIKLKKALDTAGERFDYVIVDTPPNLGALTVNGLAACSDVLIPVHTAYATFSELPKFLALCDEVKEHLNPDLAILGILPTMFAKRNLEDEQVLKLLQQNPHGVACFDPVPRTARIKSCFARHLVSMDYDRDAGRVYEKLAERIAA